MQPVLTHARQSGARLDRPEHAVKFQQAIADAAVERSRLYIAGVRAYQNHPAERDAPDMPVIWREGGTALRDYNPMGGVPILVVPSLINRFHILDLATDHSLLRFLAARGFRPLVVDWDAPDSMERDFTLADYIGRLERVLAFITGLGLRSAPPPSLPREGGGTRPVLAGASGASIHILGYCMGGLLALALALLRPAQTRSLSLMATPWHFPSSASALGDFRTLAAKFEPYLQQWGQLPAALMEALFAALQPAHAMRKFTRFALMDQTSDAARRFVLTEDWLNDGVPLTANVARECLGGWYGENLTGRLRWRVGDTVIDPRAVTAPAYVLVPSDDKLVTPESALPLARLIRNATLREPKLGHIGLLASATAPQLVWEPMAHWLSQR